MCVFVVVVVGLLVGFVVVLWIFFEYTGFHCLVKLFVATVTRSDVI